MIENWPKEKIIAAVHSGKKSVVMRYPDGHYRDLNMGAAAKMEGDHQVEQTLMEIIVIWKPVPYKKVG